jgi:hypothetical protein
MHGYKAGKDLKIKVLEEELRRAGIVPTEALAPKDGLLGEDGAKLPGVEVTKVDDFDLGR